MGGWISCRQRVKPRVVRPGGATHPTRRAARAATAGRTNEACIRADMIFEVAGAGGAVFGGRAGTVGRRGLSFRFKTIRRIPEREEHNSGRAAEFRCASRASHTICVLSPTSLHISSHQGLMCGRTV